MAPHGRARDVLLRALRSGTLEEVLWGKDWKNAQSSKENEVEVDAQLDELPIDIDDIAIWNKVLVARILKTSEIISKNINKTTNSKIIQDEESDNTKTISNKKGTIKLPYRSNCMLPSSENELDAANTEQWIKDNFYIGSVKKSKKVLQILKEAKELGRSRRRNPLISLIEDIECQNFGEENEGNDPREGEMDDFSFEDDLTWIAGKSSRSSLSEKKISDGNLRPALPSQVNTVKNSIDVLESLLQMSNELREERENIMSRGGGSDAATDAFINREATLKYNEELDTVAYYKRELKQMQRRAAVLRLHKRARKYKTYKQSNTDQFHSFWNKVQEMNSSMNKMDFYDNFLSYLDVNDVDDISQHSTQEERANVPLDTLESLFEENLNDILAARAKILNPKATTKNSESAVKLHSESIESISEEKVANALRSSGNERALIEIIERMKANGVYSEDTFKYTFGMPSPRAKIVEYIDDYGAVQKRLEFETFVDDNLSLPSLNDTLFDSSIAEDGSNYTLQMPCVNDEGIMRSNSNGTIRFEQKENIFLTQIPVVDINPFKDDYSIGIDPLRRRLSTARSYVTEPFRSREGFEIKSTLAGKWGYDPSIRKQIPRSFHWQNSLLRSNQRQGTEGTTCHVNNIDSFQELFFDTDNKVLILRSYRNSTVVKSVTVGISDFYLTDSSIAGMLTLRTSSSKENPSGYLGTFPAQQWLHLEEEINNSLALAGNQRLPECAVSDIRSPLRDHREEAIIVPHYLSPKLNPLKEMEEASKTALADGMKFEESISFSRDGYKSRSGLLTDDNEEESFLSTSHSDRNILYDRRTASSGDLSLSTVATAPQLSLLGDTKQRESFLHELLSQSSPQKPFSSSTPNLHDSTGCEAKGYIAVDGKVSLSLVGVAPPSVMSPIRPTKPRIPTRPSFRTKNLIKAKAFPTAVCKTIPESAAPSTDTSISDQLDNEADLQDAEKVSEEDDPLESPLDISYLKISSPEPLVPIAIAPPLISREVRRPTFTFQFQVVSVVDSRRIMQLYFTKKLLQLDLQVTVHLSPLEAAQAIAFAPALYGLIFIAYSEIKQYGASFTLSQLTPRGVDKSYFSIFIYDFVEEDGEDKELDAAMESCGVADYFKPPYTINAFKEAMDQHKRRQELRMAFALPSRPVTLTTPSAATSNLRTELVLDDED